MTTEPRVRHILSLSGGKDSAALAIHMRDRIDDMEYVFLDTGKELPETYEYLNKLEAYLGKPVVRLNSEYNFDHWLKTYAGFLPSRNMRWCTRMLKIKPFEAYCGEDTIYSYIGIRADENRAGYISNKENIIPVYPFIEDGINKDDVFRMLEESAVGVPEYYKWRSRSGCYFCFFQRKSEWVGLKENHPDLFEKAKAYEKSTTPSGKPYTWNQQLSLDDVEERKEKIMADHEKYMDIQKAKTPNKPLIQLFDTAHDMENDWIEAPCIACDL